MMGTVVRFIGIAIAFITGMATVPVFAGQAILTWNAPTTNEDGSELTDLAGFVIYYGQATGGPYPNNIRIADPAETTYTVENLANGTWYFVMTAFDEAQQESVYSTELSKTIAESVPPSPPDNLVVEPGNRTAYYLSQSLNVIRLVPVGTVPEGAPCDGTMTINGLYRVPVELLEQPGNASPATIYANCLPEQ